jgi:hypothetical protein
LRFGQDTLDAGFEVTGRGHRCVTAVLHESHHLTSPDLTCLELRAHLSQFRPRRVLPLDVTRADGVQLRYLVLGEREMLTHGHDRLCVRGPAHAEPASFGLGLTLSGDICGTDQCQCAHGEC